MRVINIAVLILFLAAVGVFCAQNMDTTSVRFLNSSASLPLPGLVLIVYLMGMVSGWAVVSYLRRSVRSLTERE